MLNVVCHEASECNETEDSEDIDRQHEGAVSRDVSGNECTRCC